MPGFAVEWSFLKRLLFALKSFSERGLGALQSMSEPLIRGGPTQLLLTVITPRYESQSIALALISPRHWPVNCCLHHTYNIRRIFDKWYVVHTGGARESLRFEAWSFQGSGGRTVTTVLSTVLWNCGIRRYVPFITDSSEENMWNARGPIYYRSE